MSSARVRASICKCHIAEELDSFCCLVPLRPCFPTFLWLCITLPRPCTIPPCGPEVSEFFIEKLMASKRVARSCNSNSRQNKSIVPGTFKFVYVQKNLLSAALLFPLKNNERGENIIFLFKFRKLVCVSRDFPVALPSELFQRTDSGVRTVFCVFVSRVYHVCIRLTESCFKLLKPVLFQ